MVKTGAKESSRAPITIRLRKRDPNTPRRRSAYSFSRLRSRTKVRATSSRNTSAESETNTNVSGADSGIKCRLNACCEKTRAKSNNIPTASGSRRARRWLGESGRRFFSGLSGFRDVGTRIYWFQSHYMVVLASNWARECFLKSLTPSRGEGSLQPPGRLVIDQSGNREIENRWNRRFSITNCKITRLQIFPPMDPSPRQKTLVIRDFRKTPTTERSHPWPGGSLICRPPRKSPALLKGSHPHRSPLRPCC